MMKYLMILLISVTMVIGQSCSDAKNTSGSEMSDTNNISQGRSVPTKAPRKVRIQKIVPGSITGKIFFNAVTEAIRDVSVTAKTTGEIVEMNFDIGSFVKKGSTIAVTEFDIQRAALEQAELNLKQAELNFSLKQKVFQRDRTLFENKAITTEQFDNSENGYQLAELAFNQAETSLRNAKINYNNCFIKAPFDGIIVERPVQQGQYAAVGIPVARIVDTANLQVVVGMTSDDLLTFKKYRQNEVEIILPDNTVLPGKVVGVAEAPDKKTSLYSMKVHFKSIRDENDKYIVFPGMQLKVGIKGRVHKNSFLTSRNSMRLLGNRYIVYIVENGKAKEMEVEIIDDIDKERIVRFKDGYSKPAELIISGIEALTNGREVEVLGEK